MEKVVSIKNASGLHARPAGMFVNKAAEFKSTVEVVAKDKTVNAKSIMGIMSLGLAQGEELKLVVNGEDEEVALAAMVELVESGFGE
ncbi:TPA: HPr family phosphocarrier protein [Clostridioides difficile]|uniref:HPr family phosphocarrier protein n=1 Tax=Clostridioides difficile TaxID=1496 RepID=UPI000E724D34|nr:HPr family phosphocarrier protein [Clostridioides difficile]AYC94650.1 phosphocarrier protein HPr [Clostridioides difficile]EJA6756099.1 HPr family phosphocarrier protein [Clostridioides difficile]MBZ0868027.1 HPr family phosphocarrier protein [Clostridioides difficile]MDM0153151.1 HPr family phosphocarrier protein [Clostridioides difficile]MDU8833053.1 HPr family phosphocarrier protein [Clostridioides difficile]